MQQSDRNLLFNLSYALDTKTRLFLPMKPLNLTAARPKDLERLRIQERTDRLVVMFTELELAGLAETIREIAARDEELLRCKRT